MKKIIVIFLLMLTVAINVYAEDETSSNVEVIQKHMSFDEQIEIESLPTSEFVTGVRGDYYFYESELPPTIYHSYVRSSDGAIFAGNIYCYYMRCGLINPEYPKTLFWQAFYEGTLPFKGYAY